MKKIFRILLIAFLVLNISTIYVHSETVNLIEEKLDSIGISDEYINNIVNYITNLKLSNEEINNLLETANNIFSIVKEKDDYSDFTLTELLNIYGEALNVSDELDINLDLDLSTKEVILKDKESKLTLIKCNIDDVEKYYENYKESPLTYEDYNELKSYIVENIIISDGNTDIINSNNITKSGDYNNLNDEEMDKSNNSAENSNQSNNTVDNNNYDDSNNARFNTVSAIKSKNMNRVLSIIFLVLFSCVVVSLLIDSIFFRDKN